MDATAIVVTIITDNLSSRKASILRISRVLYDSGPALGTPEPLLPSQSSPFPGRFLSQREIGQRPEDISQKGPDAHPSAQPLSWLPSPRMPHPNLASSPLEPSPRVRLTHGLAIIHLTLRPREGKGLSWGCTASWLQNQNLHCTPVIKRGLEPVKTLSGFSTAG